MMGMEDLRLTDELVLFLGIGRTEQDTQQDTIERMNE
jgi:hypothetical protein